MPKKQANTDLQSLSTVSNLNNGPNEKQESSYNAQMPFIVRDSYDKRAKD